MTVFCVGVVNREMVEGRYMSNNCIMGCNNRFQKWWFTTLYSVLFILYPFTFVTLNCPIVLSCVEFEWPKRQIFILCIFIMTKSFCICNYHGLRGLFALHTHGSWPSHEMGMSEVEDVSMTATSSPSPPLKLNEFCHGRQCKSRDLFTGVKASSWTRQVHGFCHWRKGKSTDFVTDVKASPRILSLT